MQEKFIMTDMPAFRDEEYITSINDYIIKLDFQLCKIYYLNGGTKDIITTWPLLIDELIRDEILNKDSLQKKSPEEKYEYVMNLVKRNFSWDKSSTKFASKSPDKLIKDKTSSFYKKYSKVLDGLTELSNPVLLLAKPKI